MSVHEARFCPVCGTLYGENDCTHTPEAPLVGLSRLAALYLELINEEGYTCQSW